MHSPVTHAVRLAALIIATSLVLVGLDLPSASAQSTSNDTPIRVGVGPDDQSTPIIYADKAGLFKKAGLNVQLLKLGGGAAIAAAVAGGSLEIGKGSSLSAILAISRGLPFTVIANAANYTTKTKDFALVVATKSPLQTPKDLIGRTLAAVSLDDMNSVATFSWLEAHGIDHSTMKYVEMPATASIAAMEQGRVDGSTIYEPTLSAALGAGRVRVLAYPFDAIAPRFSDAVIYSSKTWTATHPDLVARFLKVVVDATAYVSAHENETAGLIAQFGGTDPALIANIRHPEREVQIEPGVLQPVIDAAARFNVIPKAFPASDMICSCALRK
jgi:NitT/TauT family transport system substrate-binding protein